MGKSQHTHTAADPCSVLCSLSAAVLEWMVVVVVVVVWLYGRGTQQPQVVPYKLFAYVSVCVGGVYWYRLEPFVWVSERGSEAV